MTKRKSSTDGEQPRKRRQNDAIADWGGIEPALLGKLIETVTKDGGAIRFGYTRDGGAFSLGIYGDGKPFTEFCPASSEPEAWLEGVIYDYE